MIDTTNIDLRKDKKAQFAFRKTFKKLAGLPRVYEATWEQLHEMRRKVTGEMEEYLNRHIDEETEPKEDEELGYEVAKDMLDWISQEFETREKHNTKEPSSEINRKANERFHSHRTGDVTTSEKRIENPRSYRALFYGDETASLDTGEFRDFNEFLDVIASGRYDPRLEKRTFAIVSGVTGGFSVPEEFGGWFMDKSLELEIVRPRASVYPMQSATRHIVAWDNADHSDNLYGGFSGEWLAEAETATMQTGQLRSMLLTAHKLAIYCEASREVLADGQDFASQLSNALVKSIGFYLDTAFLRGSGAGRPKGVLNSDSVVKVSRAGANAVAWTDVYSMYSRLHPACQNNAVWVANHEVLPQLMNLTVNSNLVYIPGQFMGVSGAVPATLFGKPIIFTEKTPALGTEGDLILVDFSQYGIGMRQEIVMDRSNAPGWTRDVESFRVILRCDGQALWKDAVTPANGTNTLSWCVVLS